MIWWFLFGILVGVIATLMSLYLIELAMLKGCE
jgi:hypothetical protein